MATQGTTEDRDVRVVRIFAWALLGLALLCPLSLFLLRQIRPTSPLYILRVLLAALGPVALSLPGIALLSVAAHELGHVVAARLVGIRTCALIVGPWAWLRWDGRWYLRRTGRRLSGGGGVLFDPNDIRPPSRRIVVASLGGPVASLLLAIPGAMHGFGIGWLQHVSGAPAGFSDNLFVNLVGLVSASAFVASALPTEYGDGQSSDGLAAWQARRNIAAHRRDHAMSVLALLTKDMPSHEWPPTIVEAAASVPDGSAADAYGCWYAFIWHSYRDPRQAGTYLERVLKAQEVLPPSQAAHFCVDAALHASLYSSDPALAWACLKKARSAARAGVVSPLDVGVAETAVLRTQGRLTECHDRASALLRALGPEAEGEAAARERSMLKALLWSINPKFVPGISIRLRLHRAGYRRYASPYGAQPTSALHGRPHAGRSAAECGK